MRKLQPTGENGWLPGKLLSTTLTSLLSVGVCSITVFCVVYRFIIYNKTIPAHILHVLVSQIFRMSFNCIDNWQICQYIFFITFFHFSNCMCKHKHYFSLLSTSSIHPAPLSPKHVFPSCPGPMHSTHSASRLPQRVPLRWFPALEPPHHFVKPEAQSDNDQAPLSEC